MPNFSRLGFTIFIELFSLTFIPKETLSQYSPDVDWRDAGIIERYEMDIPTIAFDEVKGSFTADVTDDVVIQGIVKENKGGAKIVFPKGDFYFKEQIELTSGFILKGQGADTKLIFDLNEESDCIVAAGKKIEKRYELSAAASKGENQLRIANTEDLEDGEYLYLSDDDERLVKSWWAKEKTGQFVIAKKIAEDGILIVGELRREYPIEYQPALFSCDFVNGVGIERLTIVNNTETKGQTSTIKFTYAKNCWVGGVHSINSNYAHVLLEYSTHCEVMGGSFKNAHDYGNGGKGYGIVLQFASSDNLIMGNTLEYLRHSILLQAGANGNVITKNTSTDPYWTDVRLPADAAGDIVLHGNFAYANLIENNSCQTIVVDNSHGKNGPDNLIYQNQVNGYGIRVHRKSKGQWVVNNEIKKLKWPKGRFRVRGKQVKIHNRVRGKIKKEADYNFKDSFFY